MRPSTPASFGGGGGGGLIASQPWLLVLGALLALVLVLSSLHARNDAVDSLAQRGLAVQLARAQDALVALSATHAQLRLDHAVALGAARRNRLVFVFSSDCHSYASPWQSVALVRSFLRTQDETSRLTELVSCDDASFVPSHIAAFASERVRAHVAPRWSPHPESGDEYPPYNRPKALAHWLEHGEDRPDDDELVVVVDPDMLFMRAFTRDDFAHLERGHVVAAWYGLGSTWFYASEFRQLCPRCSRLTPLERERLTVGNPFIMRAYDLRRVSPLWLRYTEAIRADEALRERAGWLAEMYGYILGAIELELEHEVSTTLMASNSEARKEFYDAKPHLIAHYCQTYRVGRSWSWSKHDFHDVDPLACDFPLLMPPPEAVRLDEEEEQQRAQEAGGKNATRPLLSVNTRDVWLAHSIITNLNEAFDWWKSSFCDPGVWPPPGASLPHGKFWRLSRSDLKKIAEKRKAAAAAAASAESASSDQ